MGRTATRFGRRPFVWGGLALTGVSLLVGCGVVSQPDAVQPKPARIGFLDSIAPTPGQPKTGILLRALVELDYAEGRDFVLDYRSADEYGGLLPAVAAELADLKLDVILAADTAAVAIRRATTTIPIVFLATSDPVAAGLVESLGRPGGNVTGVSSLVAALDGKRVELLKQAVPNARRVAVLADVRDAFTEQHWSRTQVASQVLGLDARRHDVASVEDLANAFSSMKESGGDALIVLPSPFFVRNRASILPLVASTLLPAMYEGRQFVDAGGLMSYGPNPNELLRRAAAYVVKVLKGAKPADLPVEQPTKFDFIISLKLAASLGLSLSPTILQQVTETVQ